MKKIQNFKNLTDEQLNEVTGAGLKEKITAGTLGIASLIGASNLSCIELANTVSAISTNVIENNREPLFLKFLSEAKISETQEKAFAITNELAKEYPNHLKLVDKISSYRYLGDNATELEKILDQGCKDGDLPIQDFSMKDLQEAKSKIFTNSDKNVEFIMCAQSDALKLHERNEVGDGDIVNLASQYNALESVTNIPSSVKNWPYDKTQGPMCSLQSVAATKHREAAHLQGTLTDAIEDLLKECKVSNKSITEKYPSLYRNGYLQLSRITSEKDMEIFTSFLESNLGDMKFLSQWVKCEGSGKTQLQVFTAAPSFQGEDRDIWDKKDDLTKLRKKCCIMLIEVQYKALAQSAAIRADQTGKNVKLHITMVGHGVFQNPDETVKAALKALKSELKGHNVTVFLHYYSNNPWNKGIKKAGIKFTNLNDWINLYN